MLGVSIDELSATAVCVEGGHVPTVDKEHYRLLDLIEGLARNAAPLIPALLIVNDPGRPVPHAGLRQAFADAKPRVGRLRVALASDDALMRGVLTAIEWISPSTAEQRVMAFSNQTEACTWLAEQCGRPLPTLPRLYRQARGIIVAADMRAASRHVTRGAHGRA